MIRKLLDWLRGRRTDAVAREESPVLSGRVLDQAYERQVREHGDDTDAIAGRDHTGGARFIP